MLKATIVIQPYMRTNNNYAACYEGWAEGDEEFVIRALTQAHAERLVMTRVAHLHIKFKYTLLDTKNVARLPSDLPT